MKKNNGYILVVTMLVMVSMLVIGIAYANFYRQDNSIAQRGENDLIAEAAADAGIQDSISQLKKNADWKSGFANVKLPHAGSAYTVTFDPAEKTFPWSTNNNGGTGTVTGYQGRTVPPDNVYIISIGTYGNSTRIEHALVSTKFYPFQYAIAAQEDIKMNGGVTTDSFNSSIAPYDSEHLSSGGNIQTNSADSSAVELNGQVNVMGNITVGPGGDTSTSINAGGGSTYQSATVASSPLSMPVMSPTVGTNNGDVTKPGTLTPGTYNNLNMSGNLQLKAGTYIFTGDISLSGTSNIMLPTTGDQKVVIYVLGNVDIKGNTTVNGNTKIAGNLIIYGGPDTETFSIGGLGRQSQELYFVLYAPETEFKIGGNAQYYGSVVANEFSSTSGTVDLHYDNALMSQSISGIITVQSSW
ncbi:MAG: hypothetical protein AB2L14_16520 [Candidatus Xenobiia bacterium LiM19]